MSEWVEKTILTNYWLEEVFSFFTFDQKKVNRKEKNDDNDDFVCQMATNYINLIDSKSIVIQKGKWIEIFVLKEKSKKYNVKCFKLTHSTEEWIVSSCTWCNCFSNCSCYLSWIYSSWCYCSIFSWKCIVN